YYFPHPIATAIGTDTPRNPIATAIGTDNPRNPIATAIGTDNPRNPIATAIGTDTPRNIKNRVWLLPVPFSRYRPQNLVCHKCCEAARSTDPPDALSRPILLRKNGQLVTS